MIQPHRTQRTQRIAFGFYSLRSLRSLRLIHFLSEFICGSSYRSERAADAFFQRLASIGPLDDRRAQDSESLDLQFDDIAGPQPAAGVFRAEFEDAAGADGAGADEVAWKKLNIARRMLDDLRPGEVHVRCPAMRQLFAVHPRDHRQMHAAGGIDAI